MFSEKKGKIINALLISMVVIVSMFSLILILLPYLNKANIETYAKVTDELEVNYASEDAENRWDISQNQDGSVTATLSEDGTLTISGIGEMIENVFALEIPWDEIVSKTKSIVIENGVTSIGSYAFGSCENLISVEISDTVVSIGESVFSYCEKLTTIEIPSSITSIGEATFDGCSSLTAIEVSENNASYKDDNGVLYTKDGEQLIKYPEGKTDTEYTILNGTKSVEFRAFASSHNLTKIEIPNSVTNIGSMAFEFCDNLATIEIPNGVISIGYGVFSECINLKSIEVNEDNENYMDDNGVLYTKDKIQLIKYPEGKEDSEYTILSGTQSIEDEAFIYSYNLTKIGIPNSIENIGGCAFFYCEKLTSIEIPSNVTNIGYNAFGWCESLTNIEVNEDNPYYADDNGVLYTKNGNRLIRYPIQKEGTAYTILNVTTIIEDMAFENCDKLVNIQIPNGVESIGSGTFGGCDNLTSIEIPSSVIDMGYSVFDECCKLKSIEVNENNENYMDDNGVLYSKDGTKLMKYPEGKEETEYVILSSTKTIEYSAFINCNNLEKLQIPSTVTEICDGTFYRCDNLTIICERGSAAETYAKKYNIKYRIIGEESTITSTVQKVDEENLLIKGIEPKTTVGEIRQNLQSDTKYELVDLEGNAVTEETMIGTGYKIKMQDGKEYTLIVWGDLNGDGEIKITDLARISMIGVQDAEPSEVEKWAIDVSMDGKIAVSDLAIVSRLAVQ